MQLKALLSWCSSSLKGHVVFFQIIAAIPLLLLFLLRMKSEGALTIASAMWMAFVCVALVTAGAALFWYTFSLQLIRRRKTTPRHDTT